MSKKAMLLGKFMPPHMGHIYLAEFAQSYADELCIVVGSLKSEPIAGTLRHKWMTELFPNASVVHLTDENPQLPEEHPDFWQIWHDSLRRVLPFDPDYVFAGENYGAPLANILNAEFIPSNMGRNIIPVSGTDVRNNPFDHWNYIPAPIRSYYTKKICLIGPESTGKSILAEKLAQIFNTQYVPEYAYTIIKNNDGNIDYQNIEPIAKGQKASEEAICKQANKILICDTDLMTTRIWSETLFQKCPEWIIRDSKTQHYDLYFLMSPDTSWTNDIHRCQSKDVDRQEFYDKCITYLTEKKAHYLTLNGTWDERQNQAINVIKKQFSI